MRELGMRQRVFGSHRTISGTSDDELVKLAGSAAEDFEAVFPYDPTRTDPRWVDFKVRYEARFHEEPDHFAALAYDAMKILLNAICRAGLNKGRIRDALTVTEHYKGVTGDMAFDPNCKNIAPLFLARVHEGRVEYRRITMDKPYARVGENGVDYAGPTLADEKSNHLTIGVFGPRADEIVRSADVVRLLGTINSKGQAISLVAIPSQLSWGKASDELAKAVYQDRVLALIALDRPSSHLAEQIAVKVVSSRGCYLFRPHSDYNQHSLDISLAGRYAHRASAAQPHRGHRPRRPQPRKNPQPDGFRQFRGWGELYFDRRIATNLDESCKVAEETYSRLRVSIAKQTS
jgi:branched-chain amino acid transport system substrate-binding protein